MTIQSISPTLNCPLVVITVGAHNQLHATKVWREFSFIKDPFKTGPYYRYEKLWTSTAPFSKSNIAIETNLKWTKPKSVTPKDTTIVLVQYDAKLGLFTTPSILSLCRSHNAADLPQPLEDYIAFAINPAHQFSPVQANSIYLQLRSRITPEQTAHFLQLWPDANKGEEGDENPKLLNYPSTIAEAYQLFQPQTTTNEQEQVNTVDANPLPAFYPSPPPTQFYTIPNLQAVNFRTGHNLRQGPYNVSVRVTPQGKHCARREVFYANEIPISPLKSTVALFYWDTNPNSPTSGQPIIKSINIANAHPNEVADFLAEHRSVMTTDQLAQFERPPLQSRQPNSSNPQPFPTGEFQMPLPIQNCVECEAEFVPARITSRFCCEACRTTYYSKGRRKGPANPQPQASAQLTQAVVTQEQFQALSAQVAQLVQILTPK